MNNWTIGKRLLIAFGVLVAITATLGIISVTRMRAVTTDAKKLIEQYIPEVEISAKIQEETLELGLAMRSYGLTGEKKFYDRAVKSVAILEEADKAGHQLVEKHPALVGFKEGLTGFEASFTEYKQLIEQTKAKEEQLTASREVMNQAAAKFVQMMEVIETRQAEELSKEIAANTGAAKVQESATKIDLTAQARTYMNQIRIAAFKGQALRDVTEMSKASKIFETLDATFAKIKALNRTEIGATQLASLQGATAEYRQALENVEKVWQEAEAVGTKRAQLTQTLTDDAKKVIDVGLARTRTVATETSDNLTNASRITTIGSSLAAVFGVVLALLNTRRINRVLSAISSSLSAAAEQTAAASSQVSAASQSLAEGASEQAASLEETSASLEEMSSMTKRNADNAETAKNIANQTRAAADTGASDMKEMNGAMEAIKNSSDSIAKIIRTIDEIAFQTNILALNAAVEAARAGEAGMGFAVVADEVRSLAQRSAQAAKETAEQIEDSIRKSANGVQISQKVAQSLSEIVDKARKVDELVAEIATASREQSQGIQQVNIAVTQMDKVTQSNAANAEESASASEELNAQADSLKDTVSELAQLVGASARSEGKTAAPVARSARPQIAKRRTADGTFSSGGPANGANRTNGNATNGHSTERKNGVNGNLENKRAELPMAGDFKDF